MLRAKKTLRICELLSPNVTGRGGMMSCKQGRFFS